MAGRLESAHSRPTSTAHIELTTVIKVFKMSGRDVRMLSDAWSGTESGKNGCRAAHNSKRLRKPSRPTTIPARSSTNPTRNRPSARNGTLAINLLMFAIGHLMQSEYAGVKGNPDRASKKVKNLVVLE